MNIMSIYTNYTDLRTLSDGTEFRVRNGDWTGYVFSRNSEKYIHINKTGKDRRLTGQEDLDIKILYGGINNAIKSKEA